MAQIKTIEMMKEYPQILIDKYNREDELKAEVEKEENLLNQIKYK